jgi:hypothetical protein
MQSKIVKLMYAPANGWMAIDMHQSRSLGIAGVKR